MGLTFSHSIPWQAILHYLHLLRNLIVRKAIPERSSHVHNSPRLASFAGLRMLRIEHDDRCDLLAPLLGR